MNLATYPEDQSSQPAFEKVIGHITEAKQREVQTKLLDKKLLQAKSHEFYPFDVADRGDEA